jgi:hydroxyacylglutathione hydrolase
MTSWREDQRPVQRTARMTVSELHQRWEGADPPQVLDVREDDEWRRGHIPGSVHRPYHDIDAIPPEIDPARPVAVICASGQRAAVAASLVRRHGAEEVIHVVDGGVPRWGRSGWPLEEGGA